MAKKELDKDLLDFFNKLIEDEQEVAILNGILANLSNEAIVENFIKSIGMNKNDQD